MTFYFSDANVLMGVFLSGYYLVLICNEEIDLAYCPLGSLLTLVNAVIKNNYKNN